MISEEELALLQSKSKGGCANSTLEIAEHLRANGSEAERVKELCLLAVEQGSAIAALALAGLYEEEIGDEVQAVLWREIQGHPQSRKARLFRDTRSPY